MLRIGGEVCVDGFSSEIKATSTIIKAFTNEVSTILKNNHFFNTANTMENSNSQPLGRK